MKYHWNRVILLGTVMDTPDYRVYRDKKRWAVHRMRIMLNTSMDRIEPVTCIGWAKIAQTLHTLNLRKGSNMFVEGELRTRSRQREDGMRVWYSDVKIKTCHILRSTIPPGFKLVPIDEDDDSESPLSWDVDIDAITEEDDPHAAGDSPQSDG